MEMGGSCCKSRRQLGSRHPEMEGKRKSRRPKTRWTGDVVRFSGPNGMREAGDREVWSARRETFMQQWTSYGF